MPFMSVCMYIKQLKRYNVKQNNSEYKKCTIKKSKTRQIKSEIILTT